MTDAVEALRSQFAAERVPHTSVGQPSLRQARDALRNASGQVELLALAAELTPAHSKSLTSASAQLHAAARQLELLATGVDEHLRDGVSVWRGAPGREEPVLL